MTEKKQSPKMEEASTSEDLDVEKIETCISDLEAVFQKHSLTVAEIVLTYGNLGYKLGQNIGRTCYNREFPGPPDIDKLLTMYNQRADLDVALMLQATNMIIWIDNLLNPGEKENE